LALIDPRGQNCLGSAAQYPSANFVRNSSTPPKRRGYCAKVMWGWEIHTLWERCGGENELIGETQGGDAMALVLRLIDAAGNQITGDSKVPGYEGCIDVLEWSCAGNFITEGLLNVTFKKSYDTATVPLLEKANSSELLSANLFDIDTSNPTKVQRVDLVEVRVQQVVVAGRSAPPSEEEVILRCNIIRFYSPDQRETVDLSVR